MKYTSHVFVPEKTKIRMTDAEGIQQRNQLCSQLYSRQKRQTPANGWLPTDSILPRNHSLLLESFEAFRMDLILKFLCCPLGEKVEEVKFILLSPMLLSPCI